MIDWVPLLLTGFGSGVLGSVITTYGSQARERRDARKEALARLAEADRAAGQASNDRAAILDAGRAVGTAALLAGVPMYIVDTYLLAYDAVRSDRLKWAPARVTDQDPQSVGIHVYREANQVAADLGVPYTTVRDWLRRFARRANRVHAWLCGLLPRLVDDPVWPPGTSGAAGDALAVLGALHQQMPGRWPLAPSWPPGVINTSSPVT